MTLARFATLALFAVSLCGGAEVLAQDTFEPTVEVTRLSTHLSWLRMRDSDTGWVNSLALQSSEGSLLVDHAGDWQTLSSSPAMVDVVRRTVEELELSPVTRLINTHWHGDHTGANPDFADAEIIAHEDVLSRLSVRQTPSWYPDGMGPMHESGWPNTTFADSLTIELDTETVHLWNFGAAHTAGDAVVYFVRSDVVHMGDLFHGLHDASLGEDMDGMVDTFTETLARIGEDTRVLTGHGELSNYAELRDYRQMLIDTLEMVREGIAAGLTAEEMESSKLPGNWAGTLGESGAGPWISAIYAVLTGG